MNSTVTGPVATYLAQIRAALSDLPAGELEDVLDDVAGHLTEVAAEFEDEPTATALQERLGTPQQYADELRTAAGYPPRTRPVDNGAAARALRWGLIAATVGPFFLLIGIFGFTREATGFFGLVGLAALFGPAHLGVRALRGHDPRIVLETARGASAATSVRDLIQQLPPNIRRELVTVGQPVWWVGRGLVGGGGFFALFGAGAVTVVGALAGAAVSIWIGRRTQQDRRWLWYVVPLNVVAAIAVPAWLAASFVGAAPGLFSFSNHNDYRGSSGYDYSPRGLTLDGDPVSNLYPFDEQGRQVQVRLYTQDGRPLNLNLEDCATINGTTLQTADTPTMTNLFPLATIEPGPDGAVDPETCKDTTKAPFVPPPAPATAKQSPTPSSRSTSTPSVTPTTPSSSSTPPTGKPTPGVTLTLSPTR